MGERSVQKNRSLGKKHGRILILACIFMLFWAVWLRKPMDVLATTAEECGDFLITGGVYGVDYTFERRELTILTDTPLTIRNIDPDTPTDNYIKVADRANITLAGVNINVRPIMTKPALELSYGSGDVTITLADGTENILIGGKGRAGLQKREGSSTLTIEGDTGRLLAVGGENSAGIGMGYNYSFIVLNIVINGGHIRAVGGENGAGIGSSNNNGCANIIINGGSITAEGGKRGAGIGGGKHGHGSHIIINGGKVIARGGEGAAGIGGGEDHQGSDITINGGNVKATGGEGGAGIGSGASASAHEIMVLGGDVSAKAGEGAEDIGKGRGGFSSSTLVVRDHKGILKGRFTVDNTELTIDSDVTLTIDEDADLRIICYGILNVKGTLINHGIIEAVGTINNEGTIRNEGVIYNNESTNNNGTIYDNGIAVWGKLQNNGILHENGKMDGTGDFTVTGGHKGIDYVFEDGVLYIIGGARVTVRNTDPSTATTNRIVVKEGVYGMITLAGVNIDVSTDCLSAFDAKEGEAAFLIENGSRRPITVELADGTKNILKSGYGHAGLEMSGGASFNNLKIVGNTGTLIAQGGWYGAGIGGMNGKVGGNIYINGGTVIASGGQFGAGIGGGNRAGGVNIRIEDSNVTATGGQFAAGIGGGNKGNGRNIDLTGGQVTAEGGINAPAVGSGAEGHGDNIFIFDAKVDARAGSSGVEDIGSGDPFYESGTLICLDQVGRLKGKLETIADLGIFTGTITIEKDAVLVVSAHTSLFNYDTIINEGTIINKGTIINEGTIEGSGLLDDRGTIEGNGSF